jgi:hypothetical protein
VALSRRSLVVGLVLVAAGALLGYLAAAAATGSGAARPEAGATPVKVASRPATQAEASAVGPAKLAPKLGARLTVKTRVSRQAITTQPNKGSFVGLTCPRGYVALSGGAVAGFNDLLISHSAPIKPTGRQRYTPRTWWVAITYVPVDGSTSPLPWHPVVNCVNRIRVGG